MQEIYNQIEALEDSFAKNSIDFDSLRKYRKLTFQVREQKRFFDTMVKHKYHQSSFQNQLHFFNACCFWRQRTIYDRYIPDFFSKILRVLAKNNTPYDQWLEYIHGWESLNINDKDNSQNISLALHFFATIMTLQHQPAKQELLHNITIHPIYKKAIAICNDFIKTNNIEYINQLNHFCFSHIKNLRKTNNSNNEYYDDAWLNFYSDFQNSVEYVNFMAPYYEYMDNNNISYKNKLIFCLPHNKNIGDNYVWVQAVIHWSLNNKVPLIALLTPFQIEWIGVYYKDYFSHIVERDPNIKVPDILKLIFPLPNRAIFIDLYEDLPPYYQPRTMKRHFNHYIHNELFKPDTDIGQLVPICDISAQIKQDNQQVLQHKQLIFEKIILIAPNSNATAGIAMTNVTLKAFWQNLINRLKIEGYHPIVNLSHPNEKHHFNNVTSLYIALTHIVDFVNSIEGFIGVRTGLCDLLCSTNNIKKYCVYPIEDIDWCNDLADWFNIVHFTFDNMEQHIDDIINSLKDEHVKSFDNQQCYGYLRLPDFA